jgi:hypothetical protein
MMRRGKRENICNALPAVRLTDMEVLLIFNVSGLRFVGSVLDAARIKDSCAASNTSVIAKSITRETSILWKRHRNDAAHKHLAPVPFSSFSFL